MYTKDTYTEGKRASASNSTSYIDLGGGFDGFIVTSSLTGVVTAYMITESEITDNQALPYTTGVELPASTAAGTYKLHIGAIKCATAADAQKVIVFR